MRKQVAADYVALSLEDFRAEVAAGRAPQPVKLTPRIAVWQHEQLDRWRSEEDDWLVEAALRREGLRER